jgi:regulator of nonsense transcripts 1
MISLRHEHLYGNIKKNIIVSDRLPKPSELHEVLKDSQVIICTISMISNPKLQGLQLTEVVPVINAIIDEASQIEVGQYIPLIKSFGNTLKKLCFIGDDKQCKSSLQHL